MGHVVVSRPRQLEIDVVKLGREHDDGVERATASDSLADRATTGPSESWSSIGDGCIAKAQARRRTHAAISVSITTTSAPACSNPLIRPLGVPDHVADERGSPPQTMPIRIRSRAFLTSDMRLDDTSGSSARLGQRIRIPVLRKSFRRTPFPMVSLDPRSAVRHD
jgi:hypothetical protein